VNWARDATRERGRLSVQDSARTKSLGHILRDLERRCGNQKGFYSGVRCCWRGGFR
jgi:hypothetical protein